MLHWYFYLWSIFSTYLGNIQRGFVYSWYWLQILPFLSRQNRRSFAQKAQKGKGNRVIKVIHVIHNAYKCLPHLIKDVDLNKPWILMAYNHKNLWANVRMSLLDNKAYEINDLKPAELAPCISKTKDNRPP